VAELPTGTVTFLFTDVEGSTRLLRELGEAYADALGEHRKALRECFDRHGGVEVDTQGDAFFFAFAKASDALAAAVDGKAALEPGAIRVRMGLHTGEPLVTKEGYVGIDVHRAARIAAAGHGGQILVSQSTRDLVGSDSLLDLGEHRLKDLTAPERIYQVGECEFPSLKSLNQTNLPVQPTALIGRERDLLAIADLLRSSRLLTLTGAGGSGKTRLGLQAAASVVDEYPDGVWFVSLAAFHDPSLIEPTIAQLLGAGDDLGGFLRNKKLLLLLDNLEQLLPDAAPIVAGLDAQVLATSRERLNVSAEQEYPVPTLPIDEAVALFTQRARQLKPHFEPDDQVYEIVRRLDGLPLALELAAARVKVLTTKQILERLGNSLDLLTTGAGDAPARQRTLRATIEWSHGLLSPGEQTLFLQLGIFAGSFDLDAAETVTGAELDTLSSLVDKSLLRQTDEGRFFMLETIREYASERLSESNERGLHERHALYAIGRAEEPERTARAEWRLSIDQDYADFRAALTWLHDEGDTDSFIQLVWRLAAYWDARRQLREGRAWLEVALSRSTGLSIERARARQILGHIAWRQGDLGAARSAIDGAIAEALELDHIPVLAEAYATWGAIEILSGNVTDGRDHYERSIELFRQIGDTRSVMLMTHDLGLVEATAGDTIRARTLLEEALELAVSQKGGYFEGGVFGSLGFVELQERHIDDAQESLRQAMRIYLDDPEGVELSAANDMYAFAAVAGLAGNVSAAAVLVAAADVYYDEIGAVREALTQEARTQALGLAAERLDEKAVLEAQSRGQAMSLEEAVVYALSID
jgi:predicted ATPase